MGMGRNDDSLASVRVATTANITLSGLQTIDGVALAQGDRVLAKDQADPKQNGLWKAKATAWTRVLDAHQDRQLNSGATVYVSEGTVNAQQTYTMTSLDPIDIGTSDLVWEDLDDAGGGAPLGGTNTWTGTNTFTAATIVKGTGAPSGTTYGLFIKDTAGITTGAVYARGDGETGTDGNWLHQGQHTFAGTAFFETVHVGADTFLQQTAANELTLNAAAGVKTSTSLHVSTFADIIGDCIVHQDLSVLGNAGLGNSAADYLGFYGTAPVQQQAAPVTLADVITLLQSLGLAAL